MKEQSKPGDFLKEFDFYRRLPKDLARPTLIGTTMSVGVVIVIGLLFVY